MSVNLDLKDDAVRRSLGLIRYDSRVTREIFALLQASREDLLGKIRARAAQLDPERPKTYTRARLEDLLQETEAAMADVAATLGSNLTREMRQLAGQEGEWAVQAMSRRSAIPAGAGATVLSSSASWVRSSPELLAALVETTPLHGKLLASWTDGLAAAELDRVSTALSIGVQQGESVWNLGRRVRALQPWSRRSAEAVARTVVNGISNAARSATYAQNGHLLKGVQIVATLDSRTTPICRSLDGKVFPVDEGPRPPFHVACRTTTAPVLKSWKSIGAGNLPPMTEVRRRSLDGFVPLTETHTSWLRRQPPKVQREILGKRRAEIFRRDGTIEIEDLVDIQKNRYWTLAELGPRLKKTGLKRLRRQALAKVVDLAAKRAAAKKAAEKAAKAAAEKARQAAAKKVDDAGALVLADDLEALRKLDPAAAAAAKKKATEAGKQLFEEQVEKILSEKAVADGINPTARILKLKNQMPPGAIQKELWDASATNLATDVGVARSFTTGIAKVGAALDRIRKVSPSLASSIQDGLEKAHAASKADLLKAYSQLDLGLIETKIGNLVPGSAARLLAEDVFEKARALFKTAPSPFLENLPFNEMKELFGGNLPAKILGKMTDAWKDAAKKFVAKEVTEANFSKIKAWKNHGYPVSFPPHLTALIDQEAEILLAKVKAAAQAEATKKAAAAAKKAAAVKVRKARTMNGSAWEQVGEQAGSNPGGLYRTPAGVEYYVKLPKPGESIARLAEEVLANRFYAAGNVSVPTVQFVRLADGRIGVASKIVQGAATADAVTLAGSNAVHKGFAMDSWLANWDVVGLGYDNLLVKGKSAWRIDPGGALRYRAQGSLKGGAFSSVVGELESLRKSTMNAQSASVFGGLPDAKIITQIRRLEKKFDDATIRRLVLSVDGIEDAEGLIETMIARRDYMTDWAKAAAKQTTDSFKTKKGAFVYTGRSEQAVNAWLRENPENAAWLESLSAAESEALNHYTGSGAGSWNKWLRSNAGRAAPNSQAQAASNALQRMRAPTDMIVARGADIPELTEFLRTHPASQAKGLRFADYAFDSSSLLTPFGGTYELRIKIRKGMGGGGWVKPISQHPGEWEWLLDHGADYEVIRVYKQGYKTIVECEIRGFGRSTRPLW